MFGVFQNMDPPPPHRREYVPPAFDAGGGHTRWVERGVGGQYFGRRKTLDWPLTEKVPDTALYSIICKHFVGSTTMFVRD
jgi:hypothetical protein